MFKFLFAVIFFAASSVSYAAQNGLNLSPLDGNEGTTSAVAFDKATILNGGCGGGDHDKDDSEDEDD